MIRVMGDVIQMGLNELSVEMLKHGTLLYLTASLLAPMSWIAAVEVCHRVRGQQRPLRCPAQSPLTFSLARVTRAGLMSGWLENREG